MKVTYADTEQKNTNRFIPCYVTIRGNIHEPSFSFEYIHVYHLCLSSKGWVMVLELIAVFLCVGQRPLQ